MSANTLTILRNPNFDFSAVVHSTLYRLLHTHWFIESWSIIWHFSTLTNPYYLHKLCMASDTCSYSRVSAKHHRNWCL